MLFVPGNKPSTAIVFNSGPNQIFQTMNKKYALGEGKYYFTIKTGGMTNILINRKAKKDAVRAFKSYVKNGKDVEWHGKWQGKKFSDTTPPSGEK